MNFKEDISYYDTLHDINFDLIDTDDEYIEYEKPVYSDDELMYKTQRNKYSLVLNEWFNKPLYNHNGYIYNDNNNIDNFYNSYVEDNSINYEYYSYDNDIDYKQSELDEMYNYDTTDYRLLYNKYFKDNSKDNNKYITNRDICSSFFYELEQVINSKGYIINDINQFKEDIIYFIYRLSSLK
jgi:hypothetical protein